MVEPCPNTYYVHQIDLRDVVHSLQQTSRTWSRRRGNTVLRVKDQDYERSDRTPVFFSGFDKFGDEDGG
ncbi:hypothetical protein LENED_010362 [Lentinula edodes]|uniref:Uncharacterized protein n=1 Tax=Lentinula edodes TaxID=5353 RepID=A0A1Q3EM63_LENED|nr:hypothetical protein LENED_010362 [Lentinula edodes]